MFILKKYEWVLSLHLVFFNLVYLFWIKKKSNLAVIMYLFFNDSFFFFKEKLHNKLDFILKISFEN